MSLADFLCVGNCTHYSTSSCLHDTWEQLTPCNATPIMLVTVSFTEKLIFLSSLFGIFFPETIWWLSSFCLWFLNKLILKDYWDVGAGQGHCHICISMWVTQVRVRTAVHTKAKASYMSLTSLTTSWRSCHMGPNTRFKSGFFAGKDMRQTAHFPTVCELKFLTHGSVTLHIKELHWGFKNNLGAFLFTWLNAFKPFKTCIVILKCTS